MTALSTLLTVDVEGYLFNDLAQLQRPDVNVAFPLLMTACAGIELLGALVSPKALPTRGTNASCFKHYWTNFLYVDEPEKAKLADTIYSLGRNGLAHTYLLKSVAVGRRLGDLHLRRSGSPSVLHIDSSQLADDLRTSYHGPFTDVFRADSGAVSRLTMELRLNELLVRYNMEAVFHAAAGHELPPIAERGAVSMSTGGPIFDTKFWNGDA
jgi:hypothetical protein